jgi:hypothetical protein
LESQKTKHGVIELARMIQKENNYECAKEECPSTQFEWK